MIDYWSKAWQLFFTNSDGAANDSTIRYSPNEKWNVHRQQNCIKHSLEFESHFVNRIFVWPFYPIRVPVQSGFISNIQNEKNTVDMKGRELFHLLIIVGSGELSILQPKWWEEYSDVIIINTRVIIISNTRVIIIMKPTYIINQMICYYNKSF